MLSQTSEYALRAVLFLGAQDPDNPVRVGDIADALSVPQNYLSKVLHVLAREKILDSLRGPAGGFSLAIPADELTLHQIIEPFDPDDTVVQCLLRRQPCDPDNPCIAHHGWENIARQVRGFFAETTVAALLAEAKSHPGRTPVDLVGGPVPPRRSTS